MVEWEQVLFFFMEEYELLLLLNTNRDIPYGNI